jgi:hypothetical protein
VLSRSLHIASTVGLHICYELRLAAATSDTAAALLVQQLHSTALDLPFARVSDVVRLTHANVGTLPKLQGVAFERLEDVAHVAAFYTREELYSRAVGVNALSVSADEEDTLHYHSVEVPPDVDVVEDRNLNRPPPSCRRLCRSDTESPRRRQACVGCAGRVRVG